MGCLLCSVKVLLLLLLLRCRRYQASTLTFHLYLARVLCRRKGKECRGRRGRVREKREERGMSEEEKT